MRVDAAVAVAVLAAGCSSSNGGDDGGAAEASTASADTATTGAATGSTGGSAATASDGPATSLIDLEAWQLVDAADDPWQAERPADAACELGWGVEDGVFEVDTELCTYGTFVQPTRVDVAAGDSMELILLHDALYSDDPAAVAHLAIALGGEIAWETEIEIPALQDLVRPTFAAPVDAPAGTDVHVHVHNHGYNNYRVVDLTVR